MHPYYAIRMMGGLVFFSGACVMLFNVVMTIRKAVKHHRSTVSVITDNKAAISVKPGG